MRYIYIYIYDAIQDDSHLIGLLSQITFLSIVFNKFHNVCILV